MLLKIRHDFKSEQQLQAAVERACNAGSLTRLSRLVTAAPAWPAAWTTREIAAFTKYWEKLTDTRLTLAQRRALKFKTEGGEEVNVFRNQYRELNPDEKQAVSEIKETAAKLYDQLGIGSSTLVKHEDGASFEVMTDPRMMALAKTKLEEAVMWATKAITG